MEGDHRTTVLLSPKVYDQLRAVAKASRVSMSRVIEWALKAYFAKVTQK